MSEYNVYPSMDEQLNFPPSVRAAIAAYPELTNFFAPKANPTFTGTVSGVTKAHVGLSNVTNTSDANKPVSTAQQTALNLKANLASPTFTGTVGGITKAMVGLGNVDNTSDANKPVSTAQKALFVPLWKASTAYAANELVVTPWNIVMRAASAHTSSSSFTTDVDRWIGASLDVPFGHMGRTAGFQTLSSMTTVVMNAAQELKGGVTYDNTNNALIVPTAGRYMVNMKGYFSGSASRQNVIGLLVNGAESTPLGNQMTSAGSKDDSADIAIKTSGVMTFAKNDKLSLYATSYAGSIWGTNGYNGCFLQILYIGG